MGDENYSRETFNRTQEIGNNHNNNNNKFNIPLDKVNLSLRKQSLAQNPSSEKKSVKTQTQILNLSSFKVELK